MSDIESKVEQTHSGTGHNVGRDWNVYNFGNIDFSTDIAILVLVGSWDESKADDISVLELLTGETYSDWIVKVRKIEASENSPLQHNAGIWSVRNRIDAWEKFSSRLFKDHLDKFKEVSIKILSAIDPQFDLKPEERFGASIYGKVPSHSPSIRKGLSDGLALISVKKESLINCASNYGEYIANTVVNTVFNSSDWKLWASTQDIQPVMAEAAPDKFLDAVESAVIHTDKPFNILFSQEGVGAITGRNYMTGLLWALESLAWSPLYLIRCVVLLGEMDSHDPGGNWANRPVNSIIDILLPWLPHTTANFERRLASLKALEREFPATAWKVLLNLLPSNRGFTSGTSIPKWRAFIPDDFTKEVTTHEYYKQVIVYGNYVIELSGKDKSRLPELVEHLDHLHEDAFNDAVRLFAEFSSSTASSTDKYTLWIKLLNFVNKHRKFSDADWSLASNKLDMLSSVVIDLQPTDKQLLYKRLFTNRNVDLYEETGNWQEQENAINKLREQAIAEIFATGGYELVYKFSCTVESPNIAGNAFAKIVTEDNDEFLLELLKNNELHAQQYLAGYVWSRNYLTGGTFVEKLNMERWSSNESANFLLLLPFSLSTWNIVDNVLGGSFEHLYWENVHANAYHCDDDKDLYKGSEMLLKYGRPFSAIHCLWRLLHSRKNVAVEPTIRALLEAVSAKENPSNIDAYEIDELIRYIQENDEVKDDDRFRIEWAYLPLISSKSSDQGAPRYLEKRLASDPEFFCEMISLAYKSEKGSEDGELSEAQKNIAKNAYNLLNGWKIIPGIHEDGNFDSSNFGFWFENVSRISKETGHFYSVQQVIGKSLIFAPKSSTGLWIDENLAEFLNQRELEHVRDAYRLAVFNSRGVHWVDPEAKPEIALSEEYFSRSEVIDLLGLQRFSRTLREIAESYSYDAESIIKRYSQSPMDSCE
jgi:hypothetical protein